MTFILIGGDDEVNWQHVHQIDGYMDMTLLTHNEGIWTHIHYIVYDHDKIQLLI